MNLKNDNTQVTITSNTHRVVVIGYRDDGDGKIRIGPLAMGEIDPGKQGMPDPIKQDSLAGEPGKTGPFISGVCKVKGDWSMAVRYGVVEFNSYASAKAWLDSPAGEYFQTRFEKINMLAMSL
jgi:hypothetical protein